MERLDVIFARMQITSLILQVAIIYACTKGSEDVFYAYLPLLLTDKLKFEKVCISKLFRNFFRWFIFLGLKDTKSYTRSSVRVNQLPGYSSILVSFLPPSPSISQLYSKREGETERQADRPADWQADRQTNRQAGRQTNRQAGGQVDTHDRQIGRQAERPLFNLLNIHF